MWGTQSLGLNYTAQVYRAFCFSTLSFQWQLENLREEVLEAERKALSSLVPGPGNWCTVDDLFRLSADFSFPAAFPSARLSALASKARVYWEGTVDFEGLHEALRQAMGSTCCISRLVWWQPW